MKKLSLLVVWPLLLAAGLAFANSATAQTLAYWDPTNFAAGPGSGGTGSWDSISTNWWISGSSDTNWPSGDIANFAGASGTVTLNASETAGGLTFVTSNYLISGSSTLTLAGTPTITIPAGTNTISCPIAGTDSVTVSGPGTLSLTHANTSLTGGMTINSGSTVAITSVSGAGTGTITDNGALSVTTGAASFVDTVVGGPTSLIDVNIPYATGSENIRYDGQTTLTGFTGTINLIAALSSGAPGSGQVIMTNNGTSTCTWNIGAGATLLFGAGTGGSPYAANVILNGPGNSQPYGALRMDAITLTGNVLLNGANITIGDDSATTPTQMTGVISDGGHHYGFTRIVSGKTIVLSGANTYTGATIFSAGTLQVDSIETPGTSGPLGASPAKNPGNIVLSGGTLQYSTVNSNDYSGRFSTNSGQDYNIDVNGQTVTFAAPLTSIAGALTLVDTAGGGTLSLTAVNTYTGPTTITSGTLDVADSIASTAIAVNGGTLQLDRPIALPSGAILTVSGSGAVNLNFSGTQNITALNFSTTSMPPGTYGSPTNINVQNPNSVFTGPGVLNVQPPAYWDPAFSQVSPGSGGNGSWDSTSTNWLIGISDAKWPSNGLATFAGTAGIVTLNSNETADGLAFNTSGYDLTNASGNFVLTLGGTPAITVTSGSAEVDCALAGTGGLTEGGSGNLTLTGTNSFTGPVTIDADCALVLGGPNAYTDGTTINADSMLTISNAGNLGDGIYPGAIANSGALVYESAASQLLSGIISGSGTLAQNGPGELTLGGFNTFTGSINIYAGALAITGNLGNNPTFNTGSYTGISDNGALIYNSSATQTLGGINGSGSLTQNGSAALTISGNNDYTGTTTIGPGSDLIVTGDLGSGDYETNIINNGTFTYDSSLAQTVGGAISGSGALTLNGAGTLTLTGTNTYTGATTISSGYMALSGTGSISDSSSVSIAAGTTFDVSALASPNYTFGATSLRAGGSSAGAAGINGASTGVVDLGTGPISLSFTPQSFNGDSSDPALDVFQGALTLNGNVVSVRNAGGTPLGVGVYTLIQVSGGTLNGNATLGSVSGAGLAPSTSASLSVGSGTLNLVVAIVPAINSVALSGGNIVLSGANGPDNGTYYVLTSTNLALPLSQWTPIATNTFSATGTFSATNSATVSPSFFVIEIPPQ